MLPACYTNNSYLQQTHVKKTAVLSALSLQTGSILAPAHIAYETWGTLNSSGDNCILICHALTGDAHACDETNPDDAGSGWWNPLIGKGRVIDTDKYFIVCSNVLGSCYGSSGPTSAHPADGSAYRLRFPEVSVNDMVHAQRELLRQLGVRSVAAVIGGSLGGLQALEWAIAHSDFVRSAIVIAASPRLSTQGLAFDEISRQAIMGDPNWNQGNYSSEQQPNFGLGLARMIAMLTYTSAEGLESRFGRNLAARTSNRPQFGPRRDIDTYLHHQADKLTHRFDANSYLYLVNAMDSYDASAGVGRGTDARALSRIRGRLLGIGISSDWLFPAKDVRKMVAEAQSTGVWAEYRQIESPNGHDAFLQEWEQLTHILHNFL